MSIGEVSEDRGKQRDHHLLALLRDHLGKLLTREDGEDSGYAAVFAFLVRVVSAGIAYFSQVLLARWMGSFEYGVFVFVWVWVLMLGGLAPLGLTTAAIRFVPEYRETSRFEQLRGLLLQSRLIAVGASTLVALMAAACLYVFGHMLEGYYLLPLFLILFCLPMYTLVDLQDGIARGYGWIDMALVPPFIVRPLLLLAAMLAMWLAGFEMTAVNAACAAIFTCWVTALLQLVLLERRVGSDMPKGPRTYETRLWVLTAIPLLLFHGFELLLQNMDILVLSRYVDPSQVAIYFAALKTISLVAFVHFAIGAAWANRFSAYNARGEHENLQKAVRESVRWTFWPSLAGAIILLALGKPLLWLFGADFTSGYSVMFVIAVGLLIRAAMGPVEFILNMLGKQKACALALGTSAITNLVLNFALIPVYGLLGAAAATAISMALAAIIMAITAKKKLKLHCFIWKPAVD